MARSPLSVVTQQSPGAPPIDVEWLEQLLQFAALREGRAGEVGVWVCSDLEIAQLHEQFMGIEGPTDVMSFPGDADYLGDIAVSWETADAQAREVGHSLDREIAYLALHGLLHLFGYDDRSPDQRAAMLARQDVILDACEQTGQSDRG